jgi:hypothetical protein
MENFIENDSCIDIDKEKKEEDLSFLRQKIKQMKEHKLASGKVNKNKKLYKDEYSEENKNFHQDSFLSDKDKSSLDLKGMKTNETKYYDILDESFNKVHPLIYLNTEQRKKIRESIIFEKFDRKCLLYSGMEFDYDPGQWACFILIEGEIHVFNNNLNFQDLISKITFFGYGGPIFKKRTATVLVEKNSVLGIISREKFLEVIKPFSKFATFISRNVRYKDKTLDTLNMFKNFVLNSVDKGPINMQNLLSHYIKIDSCMHQKALSEEIDIGAWSYALNRLPECVIETYVFILMNKPPKILSLSEGPLDKIPRMKTNARNRDIYKYLDGKNVVIVREMETDVLDFVSNICIHIIESKKLRTCIFSPVTLKNINEVKNDFDKTVNVLMNTTGLNFKNNEIKILRHLFGNSFGDKLINICLNYQDINLSITKLSTYDNDPIENWIENLWNVAKDLLNVNSSVDEIDDLIVDIAQGSKKTLLSCISPHIYKNKEKILKWAQETNCKLKTLKFLNEADKLVAFSHYYYLAFPEEAKEREKMDIEHGIVTIEKTFSTGVKILLINLNKLDPKFMDPNIKYKSRSKNHLIIHIGYTFGCQSHDIIKPLLMLFGSKSYSLNIIGKAGALQGERTDILVASKIFYDKTHDLSGIKHGNIDIEDLKKVTKSNIHFGPMLTVAGTVLQNYDLLNYYKYVMGCIGLEMEGYFFVREIENSMKHGLIREDFVTRCFYYSSDLPLDPNQNLAQEEGNVSWDEGICSMNAIQRYILNQIFS